MTPHMHRDRPCTVQQCLSCVYCVFTTYACVLAPLRSQLVRSPPTAPHITAGRETSLPTPHRCLRPHVTQLPAVQSAATHRSRLRPDTRTLRPVVLGARSARSHAYLIGTRMTPTARAYTSCTGASIDSCTGATCTTGIGIGIDAARIGAIVMACRSDAMGTPPCTNDSCLDVSAVAHFAHRSGGSCACTCSAALSEEAIPCTGWCHCAHLERLSTSDHPKCRMRASSLSRRCRLRHSRALAPLSRGSLRASSSGGGGGGGGSGALATALSQAPMARRASAEVAMLSGSASATSIVDAGPTISRVLTEHVGDWEESLGTLLPAGSLRSSSHSDRVADVVDSTTSLEVVDNSKRLIHLRSCQGTRHRPCVNPQDGRGGRETRHPSESHSEQGPSVATRRAHLAGLDAGVPGTHWLDAIPDRPHQRLPYQLNLECFRVPAALARFPLVTHRCILTRDRTPCVWRS